MESLNEARMNYQKRYLLFHVYWCVCVCVCVCVSAGYSNWSCQSVPCELHFEPACINHAFPPHSCNCAPLLHYTVVRGGLGGGVLGG